MSYLLVALPYLLQLLCIIHVVRTGRNTSWIWLIIFVPYVGGVACLLVEVLPTFGRGGRRAIVIYERLAAGMHARDADLSLARARCFAALGRHHDGSRLLDELEASGHDFRTVAEALAVIARVEETRRQLDAMGQPFDRAWMRRVLRLRATVGEQGITRRGAG